MVKSRKQKEVQLEKRVFKLKLRKGAAYCYTLSLKMKNDKIMVIG
jgi:hypothetical protein